MTQDHIISCCTLKAQGQWMWWDRSGLHGSCFSVLLPNTDWLHDDAYRTQHLFRYVYIDNNTMWCDIGLAGFCDRTTGWTWCLRKQTQYEHDQLFQGHTYTSRKKEDKACYYYIIVWRLQNLLSLLYNKPTHGYILIHLTWLYAWIRSTNTGYTSLKGERVRSTNTSLYSYSGAAQ